jgi:phage tail-like protein
MAEVRPTDRDPYLGYNFLVEIDSLTVGAFSEVTGLQVETEVHDYREGGVNEYVHKLAGPTRYPTNLTLKHGLTDVNGLWKWHQDVRQGKIERKNVSIVLLDATRQEKWRWNFQQALPVRWNGPELRADRAEIAIESVELVHRGLEIRG